MSQPLRAAPKGTLVRPRFLPPRYRKRHTGDESVRHQDSSVNRGQPINMKSLRSFLLLFGVLALLINASVGGSLPTVKERLVSLGINIEKKSLIEALRNVNPEVRWLAAAQLAEERAGDAVPEIAEALQKELIDVSAVNMALALGHLGDNRGLFALETMCRGSGTDDLRLRASAYSLEFHSNSCLVPILDLANSGETGSKARALRVLPAFRDISIPDNARILQIIQAALSDPEPYVRMAAGEARSILGDRQSAAADLRKAIDNESDESVRAALLLYLRLAEQKKQ
jgi:HEAT repeat protein